MEDATSLSAFQGVAFLGLNIMVGLSHPPLQEGRTKRLRFLRHNRQGTKTQLNQHLRVNLGGGKREFPEHDAPESGSGPWHSIGITTGHKLVPSEPLRTAKFDPAESAGR